MARERELPPPLEMICLHALWEIREGNVEDVRRLVARKRQLAYTTVLTLLDRLNRRGVITRRREGRGFRYQPAVDRDKVCKQALGQFVDLHFEGSISKLQVFLESPAFYETRADAPTQEIAVPADSPVSLQKAAAAATAAGNAGTFENSFKPTTR